MIYYFFGYGINFDDIQILAGQQTHVSVHLGGGQPNHIPCSYLVIKH